MPSFLLISIQYSSELVSGGTVFFESFLSLCFSSLLLRWLSEESLEDGDRYFEGCLCLRPSSSEESEEYDEPDEE